MIPIHCENSSNCLKAHLKANWPTWHSQIWHVLSFSYISLPEPLKVDMSSTVVGALRNKNLKTLRDGLLSVAKQI